MFYHLIESGTGNFGKEESSCYAHVAREMDYLPKGDFLFMFSVVACAMYWLKVILTLSCALRSGISKNCVYESVL